MIHLLWVKDKNHKFYYNTFTLKFLNFLIRFAQISQILVREKLFFETFFTPQIWLKLYYSTIDLAKNLHEIKILKNVNPEPLWDNLSFGNK